MYVGSGAVGYFFSQHTKGRGFFVLDSLTVALGCDERAVV